VVKEGIAMSIERLGIRKVYVEVTNYCNFKCEFCPLALSERPRQHMELALFKRAIDDIAGQGIADSIAFHILGEPLMYPHIVEAVGYAVERGLRTSITTNGSLLTETLVQRLVAAGLDRLTISLQRFGDAEHESRRSPMSFDDYYRRLLNAISYVNSSGGRTEVCILLMNTATRRFFDAGALPGLSWDRQSFHDSLVATIGDFHEAIGSAELANGRIAGAVRSLGTFQSALFRLNGRTHVTVRPFFDWGNAFNDGRLYTSRFGYCSLAFKSLGILSDGRVILCCGDYDGDTALGTLSEQSLPEILLSERAQSICSAMNHFRLIDRRCQVCFGSSNPLKTAAKALFLSGMFRLVKPGPGKEVKEIDLRAH
jgi:hypothetical protein